jgi:4-hydroxybenzoate polyprenyltransferase
VTPAQLTKSQRLLAYAQLMRLPNVFTAMADIFMGFWFTHETLSPVGVFLLLLLSSSCLYTAGMVLNDVFDIEQDLRERRNRPLPSGRVQLNSAARLGWSLLAAGVIFGWCSALFAGRVLPGIIATILSAFIVSYDRFLKRTPWGPVGMGICRGLNVILGMSASVRPLGLVHQYIAQCLGCYIVGVTWFARREASSSRRGDLVCGLVISTAAIVLLTGFTRLMPANELIPLDRFAPWSVQFISTLAFYLMFLVTSARFINATITLQPAAVQAAVKTGILFIVVIDAMVLLFVRGAGPAIAVALLLCPAVILGHWIYST